MSIAFTLLSSDHCALTKEYALVDNQLQASTIANMATGQSKRLSIEHVGELRAIFGMLGSHQAICSGLNRVGDTPLVTRKQAAATPGLVARTTGMFHWPHGPALFAIDVDVNEESDYQSVEAVLDMLETCSDWLKDVHRVAKPSSSSYVGARGLRGVHVYCAVTDGQKIPELGKRLQADQWLAGKGYVKVSRSGALLVRQLSDASIYQTQRILFEAPPLLGPGVTRIIPEGQDWIERPRRNSVGRPPAHADNGMLNVAKLAPLKALQQRQVETTISTSKHYAKPRANRIAYEWHKERLSAIGWDAEAVDRLATAAIYSRDTKQLASDTYLRFEQAGLVKIADVLAYWDDCVGETCAAPDDTLREDLEPRHYTKAIITIREGRKGIFSFKDNEFFVFDDVGAPDLDPWMQAALRLEGCIRYPEPMKRGTPIINVKTAFSALVNELSLPVRYNRATSTTEGLPYETVAPALEALSYLGCHGLKEEHYKQAVMWTAARNAYDPWLDAIHALPVWDGIERLDTVLIDVCGAPHSAAVIQTSRALFAAIVMRQMKPGATQAVIPVLIGGQGKGKSIRFVKRLATALGCPAVPQIEFKAPDVMSREARISMIAELAEMSGHGRKDVETVKLWATNSDDVYRDLYDRDSSSHPRRFVLIGTANKHELNNDETGNRRFMPVLVTQSIDANWTVELPQILAEARDKYCQNESAYIDLCIHASDAVFGHNMADMHQGEGMVHDTIDDVLPPIVERLRVQNVAVRSSAIRAALDMQLSGRNISSKRVGQWLMSRGWERRRDGMGYIFEHPGDFAAVTLDDPTVPLITPFADPDTSLTKH